MKKLLILLQLLIIVSCTTNKLYYELTEIEENQEVNFSPRKIMFKQGDGLEIQISPIDVDSLNKVVEVYSKYSGYYDSITHLRNSSVKILNQNQSDNFNEKLDEQIKSKCFKIGIPENKIEYIKEKILRGINSGYHTNSVTNEFTSNASNNDYSVFSIELTNNSKSTKEFDVNCISIYTNNELLKPIIPKNSILERTLIDSILKIHPNQSFIKYFYTYPINVNYPKLTIFISNEHKDIAIEKQYSFNNVTEKFKIIKITNYSNNSDYGVIVLDSSSNLLKIVDNSVLIPENYNENCFLLMYKIIDSDLYFDIITEFSINNSSVKAEDVSYKTEPN